MYATPKILEFATFIESIVDGILVLLITTTMRYPSMRWGAHSLWTVQVIALFGYKPRKCWMEDDMVGEYHCVGPPFY